MILVPDLSPPWSLDIPSLIPGRVFRPDENHGRQPHRPTGIVIHSGDRGPDLADAALHMDISYHLAWDVERDKGGRFVQLVSLRRRAYHAGREGNGWLGIALSGPWDQDPRSPEERLDFRLLLEQLRVAWGEPALRWWTRHSDITPGKRDPGPGFDESWLEGLDLRWRRGPLPGGY